MYPEFVRELEVESRMKADLRDHGTILFPSFEHIRHRQLRTAAIAPADLQTLEPELGAFPPELELKLKASLRENEFAEDDSLRTMARTALFGPAFFLNERSVDPRAITTVALKSAKNLGVDFSPGDPVTAVNLSDSQVTGVSTTKTSFGAGKIVNCAGAWAGQIGPQAFPTRPVKGQMLCLVMPSRTLIRHVIRSPKAYLIPRSDGRLLVGATVEEAGFDKRTDPATIQDLHRAALALVPKLRDAKILEDWAGLRPGTPDALPILGATATPGYYVATGHFRDGILLAPITAQIMAAVVEGRTPEHDLTAFSPARFR